MKLANKLIFGLCIILCINYSMTRRVKTESSVGTTKLRIEDKSMA
jgi:hypothetical protein